MDEPKLFILTYDVESRTAGVLGVFDDFELAKAAAIEDRNTIYPEAVSIEPAWSTSAYWHTYTYYGQLGWEIDAYVANVVGRWYGDRS